MSRISSKRKKVFKKFRRQLHLDEHTMLIEFGCEIERKTDCIELMFNKLVEPRK